MLKENEVLYIKDQQMLDEIRKILEDNNCPLRNGDLYLETNKELNYLYQIKYIGYDISDKAYIDTEISFEEFKSRTTFKSITDSIASLLEYKNEKYGNAALEPLNIFTSKSKVGHRMDDKLARIKNNPTLQENDVVDLIGYLVLCCKENNWYNFDKFKD